MSTFSKVVFNAAGYASFRPTYPKALFDTIYKYHTASPSADWKLAVDLGCGTGQATTVISERFDSVTGVDPSAGMIATARASVQNNPRINFVQSNAESLQFLEDDSVDFISAAQAAHWFKYDRLWPEMGRVLRKGGSVALWNYSEFRLTKHPRLTAAINEYASDPSQNLGPYWEQPGRGILDNHLQGIETPNDSIWDTASTRRVYFVGDQYPTAQASSLQADAPISNSPILLSPNDEHREVILRKTLNWEGVENYLRTWSPLVAYWDAHPSDKANPEGDIVKRFVKKLQDGVSEELGGLVKEDLELEWPMALIMIRKSA